MKQIMLIMNLKMIDSMLVFLLYSTM